MKYIVLIKDEDEEDNYYVTNRSNFMKKIFVKLTIAMDKWDRNVTKCRMLR